MYSRKNRDTLPTHSLTTLRRNSQLTTQTPSQTYSLLTDFPGAQGKPKEDGRFWMEELLSFRYTRQGTSSNYIYSPGGTITWQVSLITYRPYFHNAVKEMATCTTNCNVLMTHSVHSRTSLTSCSSSTSHTQKISVCPQSGQI